MYKQYLSKAQQGQSMGGKKLTPKDYVDALIKKGMIDSNDVDTRNAVETFLAYKLGDNKEFEDLINKYYGGGEEGYISFRRAFNKIAPKLGIDLKELDTANNMFVNNKMSVDKLLSSLAKKNTKPAMKNNKTSYQAGGMLSGMPHEAGGQVLVDKQGNPMAEAEGGEIIFSVEVSSVIDEAADAYMQAKDDKDRDALALEVGRMILEERIAQKQRENEEKMTSDMKGEEMAMKSGMQEAMQSGGKLKSKIIEKKLALIDEF
jgi:hypothetical protein